MRIPNKFNGYNRDGIRLYNDPVTAAAIAAGGTATGTMAGTALLTSGALASSGALAGGIAAGTALAGGASLPGIVGGAVTPGAFGAGAVAPTVTPAATGIASGFNPANYLANSGLGNALPSASQTAIQQAATGAPANFQTLTNESILKSQAFNPQIAQTANAAPVVQTPITTTFQPPMTVAENSFINPSIPAPGTSETVKLATPNAVNAAPNVVTEGGVQAANKSGMSGDAWADTKQLFNKPNWENIKSFTSEHPYLTAGAGLLAYNALKPKQYQTQKPPPANIRPYQDNRIVNQNVDYYRPYSGGSTAERNYFTGGLEALPIQRVAEGGLTSLAVGGSVEKMSEQNAVGQNYNYPQANMHTDGYSNPMMQRPMATNVINQSVDTDVNPYTGEERMAAGGGVGLGGLNFNASEPQMVGGYKYDYNPDTQQFTQLSAPQLVQQNGNGPIAQMNGLNSTNYRKQDQQPIQQTAPVQQPMQQAAPMQRSMQQPIPQGNVPVYQTPEQQLGLNGFYDYMNQQLGDIGGYKGFAGGGVANLGGYSDGGRLLRGPGDGVSDSIPASIGNRQPARLADGEFVVPARIVSEIGNGSTEAGARKLYAMMERVQGARKKSIGKGKVAVNSRADRHLPA